VLNRWRGKGRERKRGKLEKTEGMRRREKESEIKNDKERRKDRGKKGGGEKQKGWRGHRSYFSFPLLKFPGSLHWLGMEGCCFQAPCDTGEADSLLRRSHLNASTARCHELEDGPGKGRAPSPSLPLLLTAPTGRTEESCCCQDIFALFTNIKYFVKLCLQKASL
jgi:hypothetical protein